MPSPRSSGARGSTPRAPVRSSSGIHPGLIIAALAIGGVALYFAFSSGGGGSPSDTEAGQQSQQPVPKQNSEKPKVKPSESGSAVAGKPPKRPAPTLDLAVFQKTDAWYHEADTKYTEGQAAKNKSDSTTYQKRVNESFALIEKIDKELEPYMTWQEEADFNSWAMPAEYSVLLRKLGSYSQLKVNLKRSKTLSTK